MHKIQGTYAASLTPFNEDYSINKQLLLDHCRDLLSQNIDGIAIFGTTGEANSLTIDKKIEVIHYLIKNNISPDKLVPGTGQCSIRDTVFFTKTVAKLNVKAVLILPPFYYKNVHNEGIIEYFRRVVEGVGDSKLHYLLYQIPQMSGVHLGFNVIEKLLNFYPENIVGMKDSSGDLDTMLKNIKLFNEFSVFSGSDSLALKAVKSGGAGAITATTNISGKLLSFIINNCKNESSISNFNAFQKLQEEIRSTLFKHEPVSALKAFLALKQNNKEWNRVLPPLIRMENSSSDKTIINLLELTKKMDELLLNT